MNRKLLDQNMSRNAITRKENNFKIGQSDNQIKIKTIKISLAVDGLFLHLKSLFLKHFV